MATFSYILCVCYDISEKNEFLFIFGTVIRYHELLMHVKYPLAQCQNVTCMSIIAYILYVCSDISEMNQWMFGYSDQPSQRLCAKIGYICLS